MKDLTNYEGKYYVFLEDLSFLRKFYIFTFTMINYDRIIENQTMRDKSNK